MLTKILRLDLWFYNFLAQHRLPEWADRILRYYTRLGDGYMWAIVLGYLLYSFPWPIIQTLVWKSAIAALISLALYWIVKLSVRRLRPFDALEYVHAEVPPLDKYSFPSGHVMNNLAPGLVIFWLMPQIGWLVVVMPLSWGLLRVYFGVHWLSDILAGTLLGALCTLISLNWISPLFLPG